MISGDDIKKLSELSRIYLSRQEEDDLARDLQSILDYFEKLKEVSVDGLPEAVSDERAESNLRKDETPREAYADASGLVSVAPETDEGYIKVKAVFER